MFHLVWVEPLMALFGPLYAGLYQAGPRNRYFDLKAVVGWLVNSAFQSVVVFVMVMGALAPERADRHTGRTAGQWQTGATLFTVVIITVHLEISSVIDHWTWLHAFSIIFSVCELPALLCCAVLCCGTLYNDCAFGCDEHLPLNYLVIRRTKAQHTSEHTSVSHDVDIHSCLVAVMRASKHSTLASLLCLAQPTTC